MHNYHVEDGLLSEEVNTVFAANNGAIWVGTDKGLNVIRDGVLSTPEFSVGFDTKSVRVLYEDRHENLLIGTDKGLAVLSIEDAHKISFPKELCEDKVTAICQDDKGLIWVGTDRGLCRVRMDEDSPGALLYEPIDRLMEDREISAIVQGPTGEVWIGTTKGLIKFDGVSYEEYSISESSNSNIIGSLYFDMEGNLWIGTYSGLYKYRGNSFINYSVEEGLSGNFIFPILRDSRDDLWIGTNSNGLNRYDGESFEVFRKEDGLANNSVKSALEDGSGNIWVGTDTGLNKIMVDPISKKVSFTTFTTQHGLVSDLISYIYEDENGKLYFAGTGGFTIFDGHRFETFLLDKPYQARDIWSIVKTKDNQLWIGTYKGGIFTFDGSKFTRENDRIGLHSDVCLAMAEDERGNLWIGTFEGVFMYDGGSLVTFDENEGLTSNLIYTITVDDANKNLWIGTNQGLNKLKLAPFYESNLKIIEHYGKEEGFVGVECNTNGIFNEADGSIWFGTVKGLSHYVPNAYFPNKEEAKTNILRTKIFYQDTVLQENAILDYDQNHISFDYVGICLTNPSKVGYKYRLVGYDKAWSPISKNQTATYSSLPEGKYTFEVISCNNELKWNNESTSFSFTIDTPYWETWWFRTFGVLSFTGAISLIFYIRIRNIRKSGELRLRMDNLKLEALRSQMNPHFIFNSMNAIQHYINGNDKKLANDYLSKFAALMRLILDNSQKESIPIADDLKALELYITLEQLRFEDKFTYSINIDPHIDPGYLEVPPNLIQPFVENAINHGLLNKSSPGTVTISMQMDNNYIHCIIEDDGIGRKAASQLKKSAFQTEHTPFGMQITKDRIQILNELEKSELHVAVEDLTGEDGSSRGTRVVLNIPVETDE